MTTLLGPTKTGWRHVQSVAILTLPGLLQLDGMVQEYSSFSGGRELFSTGLKYLNKLIKNTWRAKILKSNIFMIHKVLLKFTKILLHEYLEPYGIYHRMTYFIMLEKMFNGHLCNVKAVCMSIDHCFFNIMTVLLYMWTSMAFTDHESICLETFIASLRLYI